jgi:hypothetical protein
VRGDKLAGVGFSSSIFAARWTFSSCYEFWEVVEWGLIPKTDRIWSIN